MMDYTEQAVVFNSDGCRLLGIAANPQNGTDVGVLILVGGPQYRVGSHRQFTLLARSLAEEGIASLRFDYRGMGDSEGEKCEFEDTETDIAAAIEALLASAPTVSRVVLWGLCDAASSAAMFAHRHPRVAGLVLLNPWVHNGVYSPQVKLAHYYRPSFSKKDQWRRLLAGEIRLLPALKELAKDSLALIGRPVLRSNKPSSKRSFIHVMLEGMQAFQHDIMVVLSGADLTAREFSTLIAQDANWKSATSKPGVTVKTLADADHTFSQRQWQDEVSQLTIEWVKRL